MNEDLRKLCKEIYQNNKDVIDTIYTIGNDIDFQEAVDIFKSENPTIIPIVEKPKEFWFAIPGFTTNLSIEDNWWQYQPSFWFAEYYGTLKITLEIGPFSDVNKRLELLETLEQNNVKIRERAKRPETKYTRLISKTVTIKNWDDAEEVFEKMKRLYEDKNIQSIAKAVINAIASLGWENEK